MLREHNSDVVEILRFPAYRYVIASDIWTLDNGLSEPTVQTAREYLNNAVMRIENKSEEFLHRHQGTWLTIRNCTRGALVLLGAKLKCQEFEAELTALRQPDYDYIRGTLNYLKYILPNKWRDATLRTLGMLDAWEDESADVGRLKVILQRLLAACTPEHDDLGLGPLR